jgi:hypothetical protein
LFAHGHRLAVDCAQPDREAERAWAAKTTVVPGVFAASVLSPSNPNPLQLAPPAPQPKSPIGSAGRARTKCDMRPLMDQCRPALESVRTSRAISIKRDIARRQAGAVRSRSARSPGRKR